MASPAEHPAVHPAPVHPAAAHPAPVVGHAVDRAIDRAIDGPGIPEVVGRLLRSAEEHRREAILATSRLDHKNAARHHRASARDYAEALAALESDAAHPLTG